MCKKRSRKRSICSWFPNIIGRFIIYKYIYIYIYPFLQDCISMWARGEPPAPAGTLQEMKTIRSTPMLHTQKSDEMEWLVVQATGMYRLCVHTTCTSMDWAPFLCKKDLYPAPAGPLAPISAPLDLQRALVQTTSRGNAQPKLNEQHPSDRVQSISGCDCKGVLKYVDCTC